MYLGFQALIVRDQCRKLASLVQPRSQETRDLLDHGLTGQESTVLLGCTTNDNVWSNSREKRDHQKADTMPMQVCSKAQPAQNKVRSANQGLTVDQTYGRRHADN